MIFTFGGLGLFVTFMNMSEHKPSVSALRGMLESYDRMLYKQGKLDSNQVYHANLSNKSSQDYKKSLKNSNNNNRSP